MRDVRTGAAAEVCHHHWPQKLTVSRCHVMGVGRGSGRGIELALGAGGFEALLIDELPRGDTDEPRTRVIRHPLRRPLSGGR